MNQIVISIQPFDGKQKVTVFNKEHDVLKQDAFDFDNLSEQVTMLIDKYSVNKVSFIGSYSFAQRYADKLKQNNLFKYTNNQLEIEVL